MIKNNSRWSNSVLIAVFSMITVALLVFTGGNAGAAIVPAILITAFFALIYFPLRYTVLAFFSFVILIHDPGQIPMSGYWKGPLFLFSELMYDNLHKFTGISAFRFCAIDVGIVSFLLVMAIRTFMGNNIDRHQDRPSARPMKIAAFVSFGAIFFTESWGILRGGDFRESIMQIRALFWAPCILIISMRAFKTEQDFRRLAAALIAICVIRIAEGVYFLFTIARPQNLDLEFIMTHNDTVWFTLAIVMLISWLLETLKKRALWNLIIWGGIIMYGIVINQRRVAYVSLVLCVFTMLLFMRNEIRRWLIRAMIASLPIMILYIVIGLHSHSRIFAPVHSLTSVADEADLSNWTRNVENYDLLRTFEANPIIGTGWGHEYNEVIVGVRYTAWKYLAHPHNSMLGLLAFTGIVGFYLIWIYLPIGIFLAGRGYITASKPIQRTTSVVATSAVIIYMVQAYADLGTRATDIVIVVCTALGCAANAVMQTRGLDEPSVLSSQDQNVSSKIVRREPPAIEPEKY